MTAYPDADHQSTLAPFTADEPAGVDGAAPYVSIVLPCYNEEGHVAAEVARICAAMDASGYRYELLAFDDASSDGTLARLYEIAPQFPHMEIIPFQRNGGSGERAGWGRLGPEADQGCCCARQRHYQQERCT